MQLPSDHIANMFMVVRKSGKIQNSGTLSAGQSGYFELNFTVPTGYKTTGITGVLLNHPGSAYFQLNVSSERGATGTRTWYVTYYNPTQIDYADSDFIINILCIKSDDYHETAG